VRAPGSISRGEMPSLEDEVMALVSRRMIEFAKQFQAEHPEAQLREQEPTP